MLVQKYGVEVGGEDGKEDFDQIKPFHRFVLFAHDSIKFRKPMEPDIHWSAMSGHISTFVVNGGQYDKIFWTEQFNEGMQSFLDSIQTKHAINLNEIPPVSTSKKATDQSGPVQLRFTLMISPCI